MFLVLTLMFVKRVFFFSKFVKFFSKCIPNYFQFNWSSKYIQRLNLFASRLAALVRGVGVTNYIRLVEVNNRDESFLIRGAEFVLLKGTRLKRIYRLTFHRSDENLVVSKVFLFIMIILLNKTQCLKKHCCIETQTFRFGQLLFEPLES